MLGIGVLVVAVVGIILFKTIKGGTQSSDDETVVAEIPQDQRPFVSLTPTSDGHYLNFQVKNVKVKNAVSMDYLLVYSTTSGGQQGVPGTLQLNGDVEKKLLLGSESSGKFRYDSGVDKGTMTIRFRNSSGKLIGKLETNFTLTSPKKGQYLVNMDTLSDGVKDFVSAD